MALITYFTDADLDKRAADYCKHRYVRSGYRVDANHRLIESFQCEECCRIREIARIEPVTLTDPGVK